jgi:hypothetical protein
VPSESIEFSPRVFQKTSKPLTKARFTPASPAASTFPLAAGPILVMTDGQEDLVVLDQVAPPVTVDARRVADVVASPRGTAPSGTRS